MTTPFEQAAPLDPDGFDFAPSIRQEALRMMKAPHAARLLATLLLRSSGSLPLIDLARASIALRASAPQDRFVWEATDDMVYSQVPAWHWKMLQDEARSKAYRQAIEGNVKPGMLVLEIGAGTGLLAMMAARAGAEHVVTVEENPLMAEIAKSCIALNGFADRITVVTGHSTDLVVGETLPRRADLLVHEILSSSIVTEGMLPSIAHARAALLTPEAKLLPDRIEIHAALSGDVLATGIPWWSVEGLDLKPIATIDAATQGVPGLAPRKRLSPPVHIADVDLMDPNFGDQQIYHSTLLADQMGTATGTERWMNILFPGGISLTSDDPMSHWGTCYTPFAASRNVQEGDKVMIETIRGAEKMSTGLAQEELRAEGRWTPGL
ncbi:MAG: 50S ribosomal protein L11 methyltransferase [Pseudomonadota bacterium]